MFAKIFQYTLEIAEKFLEKQRKLSLQDLCEHLKEKGIAVTFLKNELHIVDDYGEEIAMILPHPSGGFEIKEI